MTTVSPQNPMNDYARIQQQQRALEQPRQQAAAAKAKPVLTGHPTTRGTAPATPAVPAAAPPAPHSRPAGPLTGHPTSRVPITREPAASATRPVSHAGSPAAVSSQPAPVTAAKKPVSTTDVTLDATQLVLDVTGIVDPTPLSDGANTFISLFRGDFKDAAISAVSMLPAGDLLKAGRIGERLTGLVTKAADSPAARAALKPAMEKIGGLLDSAVVNKLPGPLRDMLKSIDHKVDDFLREPVATPPRIDSAGGSDRSQIAPPFTPPRDDDLLPPLSRPRDDDPKKVVPGLEIAPSQPGVVNASAGKSADDVPASGKRIVNSSEDADTGASKADGERAGAGGKKQDLTPDLPDLRVAGDTVSPRDARPGSRAPASDAERESVWVRTPQGTFVEYERHEIPGNPVRGQQIEVPDSQGPHFVVGFGEDVPRASDPLVQSARVDAVRHTKPQVSDRDLQNRIDSLYHGAEVRDPIGNGSTADVIRWEEWRTGLPVGGTFHGDKKGPEMINSLENWMANHPDASTSDRRVAEWLLDDLKDAVDLWKRKFP